VVALMQRVAIATIKPTTTTATDEQKAQQGWAIEARAMSARY